MVILYLLVWDGEWKIWKIILEANHPLKISYTFLEIPGNPLAEIIV